ncbi:hypothetical protein KIS4809_3035 [Bacillus sp. ZZV12-4809]|nr:hypothetical protein KIS4809_3035 [Bacillus sp. ZZV12-4809]
MKVFYPKVNLDYWHQKTDDGDRFADYLGDKYKKRPNLGRIFDFQYDWTTHSCFLKPK